MVGSACADGAIDRFFELLRTARRDEAIWVDAVREQVGLEHGVALPVWHAKEGVIRLRGTVQDRKTKRRAEECVESIYGIDDVMNELRVTRGRSDSESTQSDERQPPKH